VHWCVRISLTFRRKYRGTYFNLVLPWSPFTAANFSCHSALKNGQKNVRAQVRLATLSSTVC
jgi:hypothetical protein